MAAPPNDDFANAITITGNSGSVMSALIDDATVQVSEDFSPTIGPSPGNQTIWYKWTAPNAGVARLFVSDGTNEPIIAVWTGTVLGSLTEIETVDNGGSTDPAVLTFTAVSGTLYHIQLGTWGFYSGVAWALTWDLTLSDPEGVCISFDTSAFATPNWTRLD